MKTTDAGNNWIEHNSGVNTWLFDIEFTSALAGIAVGESGKIVRTTDGGTNWNLINPGTVADLWTACFTSADTGFVGGAGGTILKTTDGSQTWKAKSTGTKQTIYDIYFPTPKIGYAVGDASLILKTTNGGETWLALNAGYPNYDLLAVSFTDANTGFTVGNTDNFVLRTTDGGNTWSKVTIPVINTAFSIYFTSRDTGYIAGYWFILETNDGGSTWKYMNDFIPGNYYSIEFTGENTGYFCGIGGTIVKYTQGVNTGIYDNSEKQNNFRFYPNPANGKVTIETNHPEHKSEIEIIDIQGKVWMKNHILKEKTTFEISHFPAGIYLLKVMNENNTETVKFVKD